MIQCMTTDSKYLYAPSCDEKETRALSRSKLLLCPNCKSTVTFNRGPKKGSYFSHRNDAECLGNFFEPETGNHIMGKKMLFEYLSQKFSNANVELEKHIPETKQIADILVTYTTGEKKGTRWAFEFQHSPLSSKQWKERHELYQLAGIHDFWILDAEKFLKYSNSNDDYIRKSRLLKDPQEEMYSTTGFCYFLNLNNSEVTIDFSFRYEDIKTEKKGGGYYPSRECKFHDPFNHSCKLEEIEFNYHEDLNYASMYYSNLEEKMTQRFERTILKIQKIKDDEWRQEAYERGYAMLEYSLNQYGEAYTNSLKQFIQSNLDIVISDMYNLGSEDFIVKYKELINDMIKFELEYSKLEVSAKLEDHICYRLFDGKVNQLSELSFLNLGVKSLSEYLKVQYEKEIYIIKYILDEHGDFLEELTKRDRKSVNKIIDSIDWRLSVYVVDKASQFDYAYQYRKIESVEEADELIKKVKEAMSI